jgi:prephenate dehydratase
MQSVSEVPGGAIRRVAIQGELGSFSHEAALALAPQAEIVPCALSAEVFRRLDSGEVDTAVIPIENSLAGSVLEHYDLLRTHDVRIEREHLLRVRHNLIGPPGASLATLREAYSHPIALEQCRGFFRRHPEVQPTPFYDTAGSVRHVLTLGEGRSLHAGAIASRQAAAHYGGVLLAEGIEDNPENYTRFFLIRPVTERGPEPNPEPDPEPNKVSLCFAVENRPGSLVAALEVFAAQQTNLTKLESRPVPGSPWQYIFYADYQMEQPSKADAALADLVHHCSMVKELGRYRAAVKP